MNNNNLELSYSHNNNQVKQILRKCSICHRSQESLKRLPDEFQEYSAKKGYDSYYCTNCCQIVNFLL
jgi:hypothetical protein